MSQSAGPASATTMAAPDVQEPYRTGALLSLLQLHWFIRLRWAMILAALVVLAIERIVAPDAERPWSLAMALAALAAANLLWMGISRLLFRERRGSDQDETPAIRKALIFANAQVAFDLLALTVILRYTGGVENPMAVFYLFHMAIGSLVLRTWQAVTQGMWALALYTAMALGEWSGWVTPHYEFLPWMASVGLFTRTVYVLAAIVVVACGVFGTLGFTLWIAARLDEREQQLRRAHQALQQSQTAIQDLQQRRSRFMQTAAHQLKAPLATVQTMVGLIRDHVVPEARMTEHCQKIIERCREGIAQVNGLLTLARMHGMDPARHRGLVADVGHVVQDLCQRFGPLAQEKQITLICEVRPDCDLRVRVDPTDLANCVSNLVDNAIRYTPGAGTVSVSVERGPAAGPSDGVSQRAPSNGGRRADGDFVIVKVKDTGMGIDAQDLAGREGPTGAGSVFDAFRRGNRALAAAIPGTGLGLSIVREVVEQAGGWIRVHSQPGRGSTFTVAFPTQQRLSDSPAVRNTRSHEIIVEKPKPDAVSEDQPGTEDVIHAG